MSATGRKHQFTLLGQRSGKSAWRSSDGFQRRTASSRSCPSDVHGWRRAPLRWGECLPLVFKRTSEQNGKMSATSPKQTSCRTCIRDCFRREAACRCRRPRYAPWRTIFSNGGRSLPRGGTHDHVQLRRPSDLSRTLLTDFQVIGCMLLRGRRFGVAGTPTWTASPCGPETLSGSIFGRRLGTPLST